MRRLRLPLLALASALVALMATELVLRVLDLPRVALGFLEDPDTFAPDDALFWVLDRQTTRYAVGELGFRGAARRAPKNARDLRVACIGDSCVFGSGVRYETTFGVRLARRLQAALPDMRVESLLAALPGYSTQQSRVVFEQTVVLWRPDVVVLYCGAWNDHTPAIGMRDSVRHDRMTSGLGQWRIPRLVWSLTDGVPESRAEIQALERAVGEAGGELERRVPLDEFRANVEALVDGARELGARVVVVLPAMTPRTRATRPVEAYRAVCRGIATSRGVPWLDAHALLAALQDGIPDAFKQPPHAGWPGLVDFVHPSELGHDVIAARLVEELLDFVHALRARRPATAASGRLAITGVRPGQVAPLRDNRLVVTGTGFAEPAAFSQVWLGDWCVGDVVVESDRQLRLAIPRTVPPGRYGLELATPNGPARSENEVVVAPHPLRAGVTAEDGKWRLELAMDGTPGWSFDVLIAGASRVPPVMTQFGLFHLAADPDGRPAAAGDGPFLFGRVQLPRLKGVFDDAGRWRHRQVFDPSLFEEIPDALFLQAIVAHRHVREAAVCGAVVRVSVPR